MGTSIRSSALIEEAASLAADGEIGNSDAIRLLHVPHTPEDLHAVLQRFHAHMTPEARSKLTLAALVPLPDRVANQRFEPIFDRHRISGKTYTTANGTTVPNEIQYYNGEMVQIYGDCLNPALVRDVLAGSGYQPMMLRYRDGRQTAVAQFWAHNLTDTSLRPYNAMFIVVAAVREGAPLSQTSIAAHDNGASSLLPVLYGSFNAATGVYENAARLYFVRLLDSTKVAIDVGRERMGTDKRPGTIDITRSGRQIRFSVKDGAGRGVARIAVTPDDDRQGCLADLARAAVTAGIPLDQFPAGTEYVYPSVARIGDGPVVTWQWRTDLRLAPQRVRPDTVAFDPSSEEGDMLIKWGFQPQVLVYIPNVRGVVTGVPEPSGQRAPVGTNASRGRVVLIPK